jgi:hypothetical protein
MKKMRACFLGQNVCALGFGVATLQIPPVMSEPNGREPYTAAGFAADVTPARAGHDISTRHVTEAPCAGMAEKPVHLPDPPRVFPV